MNKSIDDIDFEKSMLQLYYIYYKIYNSLQYSYIIQDENEGNDITNDILKKYGLEGEGQRESASLKDFFKAVCNSKIQKVLFLLRKFKNDNITKYINPEHVKFRFTQLIEILSEFLHTTL